MPDRLPIDPDGSEAPSGERTEVPAPGRANRPELGVFAAVALGGALGAPARYGVAQLIHIAPNTFPWATLWTNISGSFALGLLLALIVERFPPSRYLRPFAATGFIGAYTTYSTFAVETDVLVMNGHVAIGLAYAGASLLLGCAAVWAGLSVARARPSSFARRQPDEAATGRPADGGGDASGTAK